MKEVTKESLSQWIAELESQPHLSLREERYLAVMKYAQAVSEQEPVGVYYGRTAAGWRAEALLQRDTAERLRKSLND